jgi:hypothetical protein
VPQHLLFVHMKSSGGQSPDTMQPRFNGGEPSGHWSLVSANRQNYIPVHNLMFVPCCQPLDKCVIEYIPPIGPPVVFHPFPPKFQTRLSRTI